jgi:site-specific recombinase XerC
LRRDLDQIQTHECSAPTAKLRLATLRHLFDWLVTGRVIPTNPVEWPPSDRTLDLVG